MVEEKQRNKRNIYVMCRYGLLERQEMSLLKEETWEKHETLQPLEI